MPFRANFEKLKPEPAKPAKNFPGVICAVEAMCASASRTVHSVHRDRVRQRSSARSSRSSARAPRSRAMVLQRSLMPEP